jgi:hypothetical protein
MAEKFRTVNAFPGPATGNIFLAIEVVVLRHPIICLEFNVLPFLSVADETFFSEQLTNAVVSDGF